MARTQAADYDAKRAAITEQAAALFAEKGFAAASVAELAERCAVSKSLIYHYYPAKEAILFDVMNEHVDELLEVVGAHESGASNPLAALAAISRDLLAHYVGAAARQKVLLYELGALPDENRRVIVGKQRTIIASVEKLIAAAAPAVSQDRKTLRARTMLYFGMLNWTHTWFRQGAGVSRDDLADMAAEMAAS